MKNNILKYRRILYFSTCLAVFLFTGYSGFTQGKQSPTDEFFIDLGGGLSGFTYQFEKGKVNQKMGGLFGVGITHFLNANWGLSSGIEYQSYAGYASAKSIAGSYNTKDIENAPFEFQYQAGGFKQIQKVGFFNIPVTVQYQPNGRFRLWYARAGVQFGFPATATYQTSVSDLQTAGDYTQYQVTLKNPTFMGFGSFPKEKSTVGYLNIGTAVSALAEVGIKRPLTKGMNAYLGVYFSYGINNIVRHQLDYNDLINYQTYNPEVFSYPRIFETPYARSLRPISVGLRVRIAIL